jgi:hypothetical protein
MPLETATVISDLVATNPAHTDGLSQADAHLRLIKTTLKATFPNVNGVVNATPAQMNMLTGNAILGYASGSAAAPSINFTSTPTVGFFFKGTVTNKIGISGRLDGNGTLPTGAIVMFPRDPGTAVMARGGVATGTETYVELDGSAYNFASFPDLGTFYGSGGANFAVDNLNDTGRYPRARASGLTVGTKLSNVFKSHSHTFGMDPAGSHNHGGATGLASTSGYTLSHDHSFTVAGATHGITGGSQVVAADNPSTGNIWWGGAVGATTGSNNQSLDHLHSISTDGSHTHFFRIDATGDTETRPETFVMIFAIKT